jgi:hypothetical protein
MGDVSIVMKMMLILMFATFVEGLLVVEERKGIYVQIMVVAIMMIFKGEIQMRLVGMMRLFK